MPGDKSAHGAVPTYLGQLCLCSKAHLYGGMYLQTLQQSANLAVNIRKTQFCSMQQQVHCNQQQQNK